MIIREVECPGAGDLFTQFLGNKRTGEDDKFASLDGIRFMGSGKGAMAAVLGYLRDKKILKNKLSEVMVADWIGYWVYNQINPFAFPSKSFSPRTRAMLVYHQYGFPQKMDEILDFARDKDIIVIEDCAHAVASSYKGKPAGSFGDFSIYSFSKWVFCYALGGVRAKPEDFPGFLDDYMSRVPLGAGAFKDFSKLVSEYSLFSRSAFFRRYASLLLNSSYALYGDALKPSALGTNLLLAKFNAEILARKENYAYFLKETRGLGVCDHLDKDRITPYVIPIICKTDKQRAVLNALGELGVQTGVYNFDVNRNMLAPKFVPSVWVPCHGKLKGQVFERITGAVAKALA